MIPSGSLARRRRGVALIEMLVVVGLFAVLAMIAIGVSEALRTGGRLRVGARTMAQLLTHARSESVALGQGHGLAFARDSRGWYWRRARDGNGNGLRKSEIASGVDPVAGEPERLEQRVTGVRLGIPAGGPFPAPPPGTVRLSAADAPVRFGASDLVAFGPLGGGSSGTLFLTAGGRSLSAVVLYGPTARLRVWHYDPREDRWRR